MKSTTLLLGFAALFASTFLFNHACAELSVDLRSRETNASSINATNEGLAWFLSTRPQVANDPPPITDEEWNHAVMTGCNLLGAMAVQDSVAAFWVKQQDTAASSFTEFQAFQDWGYDQEQDAIDSFFAGAGPNVNDALNAIGIDQRRNDQGGTNFALGFVHTRQTVHNNKAYPPTNAQFRTIVNVDAGVIIGWFKYGPKYKGSELNPPVTTLPALKNWHDVAFLTWQAYAQARNKPVANLHYIFSAPIYNSETQAIVNRAVDDDLPAECEDHLWRDRSEFLPHDEEYKALIASPNGRGAALMLITHKAVFGGRKIIESVTVFCSFSFGLPELNLMFKVKDEEEEDDDDDWDDDGVPDILPSPSTPPGIGMARERSDNSTRIFWI